MNLILHDFSFIKFWSVPCSQFLTSEYITLWNTSHFGHFLSWRAMMNCRSIENIYVQL